MKKTLILLCLIAFSSCGKQKVGDSDRYDYENHRQDHYQGHDDDNNRDYDNDDNRQYNEREDRRNRWWPW